MDTIKTFEAVFNENGSTGVYGISLVKKPAMEGNFIALSKQEKINFKEVSKEEQKIIGLVLEPNKMIYRSDADGEYNIFFSENTVKNLSYNFFKQKFQSNSTIEHNSEEKLSNVTFVESWLVEDPEKDKQQNYGFNYPKGSWLAVLKIDDKKVWDNYIKTGQVAGFSIDGLLELKEIKNQNMSEQEKQTSILEEVKDLIKATFSKKEQIKLGEVKTKDGSVTIMYEGDELVSDIPAFIMSDDEERIPVPVGEHPLEGGKILVVVEEGVISEIKEETEQKTEEASKENNISNEIASAIKSVLIKYSKLQEKLDKVVEMNEQIQKDNEDLKLALSKEPSVKKVNAVPTQIELKTTRQRLYNKLINR